jgi:hypothetical protein
MEQSPSIEGNRFPASQELTRILRNPKVHYRIHNSPPPVSCPEPEQSSFMFPVPLIEDPF